ncbi:MAG TPA: choice-of-anchor tandem repeat GloVer-containing protein [Terriglobales bacterium]|nr:choice-of-anchor tandem repeat GloVer-containing protein [Terriglobales bacterium]
MANKFYAVRFLGVLGLVALAQAQTFTTLYNFCSASGCTDGYQSYAGVVRDPTGNIYGTTYSGGISGMGVVYEVSNAGVETVLHSFSGAPSDGAYPEAPLIRDSAGNLYGTTVSGGAGGGQGGGGTVFKIDTAGKETLLHNFTGNGSDGCEPLQGLVLDKAGTLYGTTSYCGAYGAGTIFKLDKSDNETVLHSFEGGSSDGGNPEYGHLILDTAGNLYGVALGGGSNGQGVVYKLNIRSGSFAVLHSFGGGTDGCWPYGSVTRDKAGNLYGITWACGSSSNYEGTIWKVSTSGQETILHNFSYSFSDGCYPYAGVTLDSKGNLYGVTSGCGANNWGALYKLSATGRFVLLHSFDYWIGADPIGEVLRTTTGTLFGTSFEGGANAGACDQQYGCGTVWSYEPKAIADRPGRRD